MKLCLALKTLNSYAGIQNRKRFQVWRNPVFMFDWFYLAKPVIYSKRMYIFVFRRICKIIKIVETEIAHCEKYIFTSHETKLTYKNIQQKYKYVYSSV